MGRKVNRFRCIIPNSLVDYVDTDSSGIASKYKIAHFLSILTNHILSNYPDGDYYLKKPITSEYISFLYTLRYTKQVVLPLRTDGVIEVNDSYSTDLNFSKEYGFNKDIIQEIIREEFTEVYITKNTLINRINEWQRETLSRHIKHYRFTYSNRFYTPNSVTYYDPGITTLESSNGYMRGNLTSSPNSLTIPSGSFRVIQMPSVLNSRYCSEYNRSNKSQEAVGYTVENTPLYVEVKISSKTEILSTSKHYCVDYIEWNKLDSEKIYNDLIRKGECASPVVDENTIYFFYP